MPGGKSPRHRNRTSEPVVALYSNHDTDLTDVTVSRTAKLASPVGADGSAWTTFSAGGTSTAGPADATAAANHQRTYDLGEGIPDGAEHVGDLLLLPGGGADIYDLDSDGARDITNLLPSQAVARYRTYWREPGVDPL